MHPEKEHEQDGGEDGWNYASCSSKNGGCRQPWWCAEATWLAGNDVNASLGVEKLFQSKVSQLMMATGCLFMCQIRSKGCYLEAYSKKSESSDIGVRLTTQHTRGGFNIDLKPTNGYAKGREDDVQARAVPRPFLTLTLLHGLAVFSDDVCDFD